MEETEGLIRLGRFRRVGAKNGYGEQTRQHR